MRSGSRSEPGVAGSGCRTIELVGDVARGLAVSIALAGCNQIFGIDKTQLGTPDADLTSPRVFVPELHREATAIEGPYLFEGTGYRFASIAARTPGTHVPVPIVIDRVQAGDTLELEVPPELGAGWEVCGQAVAAGPHDLAPLLATAPCRRTASFAAFTVVVPVAFDVGASAAVSPLAIRITRAGTQFEHAVAIVPLDEADGTPAVEGVYAALRLPAFAPDKAGPAVDLKSITDVEIEGLLDARGGPGAGHTVGASCTSTGCAGGNGGPGNPAVGASSSCGSTLGCDAPGAIGGRGGRLCSTGGTCTVSPAPNGGGGGHAAAGMPGADGGTGCSTGPAGGEPVGKALLLVMSAGGGGGAGATIVETASTTTTTYFGGGGGGGGGKVTIEAQGRIALGAAGRVDVSGGNGGLGGPQFCNGFKRSGHGGGGAGGAIRLSAHEVTAQTALGTALVASGGLVPGSGAASGAAGRIRVDGVTTAPPTMARGPSFELPTPITDLDQLALATRASNVDPNFVFFGARAAGGTAYLSLFAVAEDDGTATAAAPLALGLNEVCVFDRPAPHRRRRCRPRGKSGLPLDRPRRLTKKPASERARRCLPAGGAMIRILLLAAATAVATPTIAAACANEVEWTVNDYVRLVVKAERQVEDGSFTAAKRTLGRMRFPTAALQERAADLKAIIALRTSKDTKQLERARDRFKARSESKEKAKDLRFRAWYAEALLALGADDEARTILVELKERDLMPDAYAYHALARLSTGMDRYELYKACRTRAKNKAMCELPAEVKTAAAKPAAQARR